LFRFARVLGLESRVHLLSLVRIEFEPLADPRDVFVETRGALALIVLDPRDGFLLPDLLQHVGHSLPEDGWFPRRAVVARGRVAGVILRRRHFDRSRRRHDDGLRWTRGSLRASFG
jgi:hypothetical protein